MSLQDQIKKVERTTMSQIKLQKHQLKLYERLSKPEIIEELNQRAVKFISTIAKKDLLDILSYEMHGIQRLPALWYGANEWSNYEILSNEPLNHVSNYIKNIYLELPSHMTNNKKRLSLK